jgi:hypothetical protein
MLDNSPSGFASETDRLGRKRRARIQSPKSATITARNVAAATAMFDPSSTVTSKVLPRELTDNKYAPGAEATPETR